MNEAKNLYDVYDMVDKEFIVDHATQAEIKAIFKGYKISCQSMAERRSVFLGRYLIAKCDDDPREWIDENGDIDRKCLPSLKNLSDIWAEWQEATDRFSKVEWTKKWEPGVKVLGR